MSNIQDYDLPEEQELDFEDDEDVLDPYDEPDTTMEDRMKKPTQLVQNRVGSAIREECHDTHHDESRISYIRRKSKWSISWR